MSEWTRAQVVQEARGGQAALALEKILPGLFPPLSAGIGGSERRIVLSLVLMATAAGTLPALLAQQARTLPWLGAAALGVFAACVVPWHRFHRGLFAIVAPAVIGWTAGFVHNPPCGRPATRAQG